MKATGLLVCILASAQLILTIPIMEHLRSKNVVTSADSYTNESVRNDLVHENSSEVDSVSSTAIVSENDEEISRDWLVPEFLSQLLPSNPFLTSSSQVRETTGTQVAPNDSSRSLLSRLFSNIIIERPSIFRVQFYNSDFEDSSSPDDDNSTSPNVVFGSPLCLGLCVPVQVFSENTSIHFLSDKQISVFPPSANPTPLYPLELGGGDHVTRNNLSSYSQSETGEENYFGWLSSWIPTAPSLTKIQNSIRLPEFSNLPGIG